MADGAASCELVGFAGIIVQLTLAFLSFSVLIYKRYKEKPKRAWKIWFMDTSKQGASQSFAHIINIVISIKMSANIESDACIWYLTTNVLDNTVGVFLCIGALSIIEKKLFEPNYTRFQSGNYYTILSEYDDEKEYSNTVMIEGDTHIRPLEITHRRIKYAISYWDWAVQFVVWNIIVIISKTLVYLTQTGFSTPIVKISLFLIGWIQPYQTLQLILVIIVVPVIMNGLAFWIQDNFLMKKDMTPVMVPIQKNKDGHEQMDSDDNQATGMKKDTEIKEPLL